MAEEPRPDLVIFTGAARMAPGFASELESLADPALVEVTDGLPGKKDLDRGRYLALWDPAVTPEAGAIAALTGHMDENPLAGIAAPMVAGGAAAGKLPPTARIIIESRIAPRPAGGAEVECVSAPPVVIRPETLEETGIPKDGRAMIPLLCRRARRRGWRINLVREAVFHPSAGWHPHPGLGFLELCRFLFA